MHGETRSVRVGGRIKRVVFGFMFVPLNKNKCTRDGRERVDARTFEGQSKHTDTTQSATQHNA